MLGKRVDHGEPVPRHPVPPVKTMTSNNMTSLPIRRAEADEYSRPRNLDMWGMRVAWFVVREGVTWARRACAKYNKQSPAWRGYQNLLIAGLIVEGPEGGLVYDEMPKWENGDGPLLWLEAVAHVASGGDPAPDLPRRR